MHTRCRNCGHILDAHIIFNTVPLACRVQICPCVAFAEGEDTQRPR